MVEQFSITSSSDPTEGESFFQPSPPSYSQVFIMRSHTSGTLFAILLLIIGIFATIATADPSSRDEEAQFDIVDKRADNGDFLVECLPYGPGKVGGRGTGYFSLVPKRLNPHSWSSDPNQSLDAAQSAAWLPSQSLLLQTGPKSPDSSVFVFKINNWATREAGVNYAYQVPHHSSCYANPPTKFIKPTTTFAVKVMPL